MNEAIPSISVVIPTYNRAHCLTRAIKSVIEQQGDGESFNICEIIVVDDNSQDDTKRVLDSLNNPRIRYYKLDRNGGAGNARNIGAGMAKGDWIAFQDSDDEWLPQKTLTQLLLTREHPEYMLVYGGYTVFEDGEKSIEFRPEFSGDIFHVLAKKNYIGAPTVMVRREAWNALGGFDISLPALEDWDYALRFAYVYQIGCVNDSLLKVHLLASGLSGDMQKYFVSRCMMIVKNRQILVEQSVFNDACEQLFKKAEEYGLLERVGALLEACLGGKLGE